ncbi:MAG: hypothetical protein A2140_08375 [Candidatus Muproteobacteria bacterium RBG_16_62_13]|uniref:Uncharacterized protein n=1 Tax=Candidatus Muproteobacteria bacterium RBG_16_62_13 TaxID=1817756 RepID=A0A1F6SX32_9PROT|nr:MAG: hypothetical protein A2140_08375 [Candidatus Muproteobacteria bacterium RBG_16_62_13]
MAKARKPVLSETETWTVETTIKERYGETRPAEIVDSEIRLHPDDRTPTPCQGIFWNDGKGCHFVIFKIADGRFRCQFYYRAYEQYGTGKLEYDDIGDCVVTLLQVQADHERKQAQRQGKEGEPALQPGQQPKPDGQSDESWYYEPVIWE